MKKVILLDNIRSLQNVWAIFRNADGAWFDKVILTGYTPTPPRWDISKTALWAEYTIDWEYYQDTMHILQNLKQDWYTLLAVELTDQAIDYRDLFWQKFEKVCLVVGHEKNWVSQEVLDFCEKHVIIPMRGKKESLNVSVAAGIVMFAL